MRFDKMLEHLANNDRFPTGGDISPAGRGGHRAADQFAGVGGQDGSRGTARSEARVGGTVLTPTPLRPYGLSPGSSHEPGEMPTRRGSFPSLFHKKKWLALMSKFMLRAG